MVFYIGRTQREKVKKNEEANKKRKKKKRSLVSFSENKTFFLE